MSEDLINMQKDLILSQKKTIATYEELVEVLKSRIVELEQKSNIQYPQPFVPVEPYYPGENTPWTGDPPWNPPNWNTITTTGSDFFKKQADVSYKLKKFLEES